MSELTDTDRVAVYIDFDNIVISRYNQLHGDSAWHKDNARDGRAAIREKLAAARIDVGAILDFASSFGTVALTRAYADWSVRANADYKGQLVDRAIDLTQLFPASGTKNGADIRLSVDVLEDLFRLPDITHVVIVAGDSDYIALAQRSKRLGRVVVGIGVAGGTAKALIAACDEFEYYDTVAADAASDDVPEVQTPAPTSTPSPATKVAKAAPTKDAPAKEAPAKTAPAVQPAPNPGPQLSGTGASRLLIKALTLTPKDDDGWSSFSAVKTQMKRLNPEFAEKTLGFSSFTDFVKSRNSQVEVREVGLTRFVRARVPKKS